MGSTVASVKKILAVYGSAQKSIDPEAADRAVVTD
jgi:hypothetical protein